MSCPLDFRKEWRIRWSILFECPTTISSWHNFLWQYVHMRISVYPRCMAQSWYGPLSCFEGKNEWVWNVIIPRIASTLNLHEESLDLTLLNAILIVCYMLVNLGPWSMEIRYLTLRDDLGWQGGKKDPPFFSFLRIDSLYSTSTNRSLAVR